MRRLFLIYLLLWLCNNGASQPINRKQLVERHTILNTSADTFSSLSVGNGSFAFTVDVTGLQSFPDIYANGVPLGTESEWGWHSFPNVQHYTFEETLRDYDLNGRTVSYSVQLKSPERNKNAVDYFRQNPHRLQLGNIGFEITMKDGSPATINDIQNIHQTLNPWKGEIHSIFSVENIPVNVITYCNQRQDAIAIKVNSPLLKEKRLHIRLRFPYPTGEWADKGDNWENEKKHQTSLVVLSNQSALFKHTLDTTTYFIYTLWKGYATVKERSAHYFIVTPSSNDFEFTCRFDEKKNINRVPSFSETSLSSGTQWMRFWQSGGAIDFSGSTDERALELERRIILSEYLTKIQCAGNYPPQETGLTYNSWYGKFHLEMNWWHTVHFALWGRINLLEKSLNWYSKAFSEAKRIAERQGYKGIRWQKMTDNEGKESPSSVGAFLIWQQPHLIYLAELVYRQNKNQQILNKYKDLLFATADFMASFPSYDPKTKKYNLGKGLIPAQECFDAVNTLNPTYELAYWSWALQKAQEWRLRLGLSRNKKWDEVINNLAPFPQKNGVYIATETTPDCYEPGSKYLTDHPAVLGAYGTLPAVHGLDTLIMKHTLDTVLKVWQWKETWGWDFPLIAMTAARLHEPEIAVNTLLMPTQKNTYLQNGHNYQDDRLTIYLPGNGGLLSAVALMCTGADADKQINIGFPKGWKVKWEGLKKML